MEGREIASSYLVVRVAEERLGPAGLVHGHVAEDLVEGVLADEHVHVHRPLLADPVHAVDGLLEHGRVPPAVEEDAVVGHLDVQADAARRERDQQHRRAAAAPVDEGLQRRPSSGVVHVAVDARGAHAELCEQRALEKVERALAPRADESRRGKARAGERR